MWSTGTDDGILVTFTLAIFGLKKRPFAAFLEVVL